MCAAVVPQADEAHPAGVDEAAEHRGEVLRRLAVAPVLVGEAGVGNDGDARAASADGVRTWSVMNSGPVAQLRPT